MAKFLIKPTVNSTQVFTVRLGTGTGSANYYADTEKNKWLKLVGESRFAMCAAGDDIEGQVAGVDTAPSDQYSTGGRALSKFYDVTFDGLQATPGTGTVAIGDYVVCGTVVAKGTALSGPPRVTQATSQANAKASPFAHRVVSLGSVATGAVGTTGVIERLDA